MIDVSKTTIPDSTRLNADDLLSGSKTIEITAVKETSGEYPIAIEYKGGEGKPYPPCKSMRRVMVQVWGRNGEDYVGKSLTLVCDPSVRFGGSEVGGIRISHMSDITDDFRMMLTKSRGKREQYVVRPLVTSPLATLSDGEFERLSAEINACETMAELAPIGAEIKAARYDADGSADLKKVYGAALEKIRPAE